MSNHLKIYAGRDGDVSWNGRLCIHIGECGRAANTLFVGGREPWCQPDTVGPDTTAEVVARCPTGSLAWHPADASRAEQPAAENTVTVANNGPLYLRGDLQIDGAGEGMPGVRLRAALCRCGQSKNKPFCDNSHEGAGFVDRGAVGATGDGGEQRPGPLVVKGAPNGPLLLSGDFKIRAASGRIAWRGTRAALCRCGHSKNKPFCDGMHKAIGFVAP